MFSRRWIPWFVLLGMIALNVGVRVRLAPTPLERDEGEYAYAGQLILAGIPPYVHAYNMKFPGTYLAYAGMMRVFGQTATGVHLGMAVVTSINLVLLFLLARRLWNDAGDEPPATPLARRLRGDAAAVPAMVVFGLLQLDVRPLALSGHATHVVLLAGLAGLVLLPGRGAIRFDGARCLLAGVCFGLAVLAKQPGAMFVLLAELWLLCDCVARRGDVRNWVLRSIAVALGSAVPLGLTILWLWHGHALASAKYWTIDYGRAYGSETPLRAGISVLAAAVPYVTAYSRWLWLLGLLGVAMLGFRRGRRWLAVKMCAFMLLAFAAVSAGFYYRPHYFILLMPVAALGAGALNVAAIEFAGRRVWLRRARFVVWIGVVFAFVASQAKVWFALTPEQVCTLEYGDEAFITAVDVGQYLRSHGDPADTVAVFGSEPEIYFYARRRSATGYIYTYPLFENQPFADTMQHDMARQIEQAKPLYIVAIPNWRSWGNIPASKMWIFDWGKKYLFDYEPAVDFVEPSFGSAPPAGGPEVITVLRRRAGR